MVNHAFDCRVHVLIRDTRTLSSDAILMPAGWSCAPSLNPALFLEPLLEHIGDFPGGLPGTALNGTSLPRLVQAKTAPRGRFD
jgi:hypothetical protein